MKPGDNRNITALFRIGLLLSPIESNQLRCVQYFSWDRYINSVGRCHPVLGLLREVQCKYFLFGGAGGRWYITCSHSPLLVSQGPDPHDEGGFPEGTALLLLCRHDVPGLHVLRLDCTGAIPREGNPRLTGTRTSGNGAGFVVKKESA